VYDRKPGGIGICYAAFQMALEVVRAARQFADDCNCEKGCPKCVHDFQCSEYNQRLDKQAALDILQVGCGVIRRDFAHVELAVLFPFHRIF